LGVFVLRDEFSLRLFLLICVVCAFVASLCLLPGLGGGFVMDDVASIKRNTALQFDELGSNSLMHAAYSFQPGGGSRPVPMLTFALDQWRGGGAAHAFKVTNLAIHALTVVVLAFFVRKLLLLAGWPVRQAAAGALLVALLWGVHPLQVSSVLYVVQRMQTLVTLFMALALWAYLLMRQAQIEGRHSRLYGLLVILFWALGLACKEDAVLLPAYALIAELTVLKFAAASDRIAMILRRGYLLMCVVGSAFFFLIALPHFWSWDAYPFREFSTIERLLTQGRVLVTYLQQILLPLPSLMPFYYDDFRVSRGLLDPPATIFALGGLAFLLAWAWRWRGRRPVFSFGVFLFFAGHFITSNVVNLELAFEHRNHLPLIGILLGCVDLGVMVLSGRGRFRANWLLPLTVGVLVGLLATLTVTRAHMWGDPMRLASGTLKLAPQSERAWLMFGAANVDRSGFVASSPWLDSAITVNGLGVRVTGSAVMQSNVVVYKTIRGDVTPDDWQALQLRVAVAPVNVQNRGISNILLNNVDLGLALDHDAVAAVLKTMARRVEFDRDENLRIATFVYNETSQPLEALMYMRHAVELSAPDDPVIAALFSQLSAVGRDDWVRELRKSAPIGSPGT